MTLVPGFPLAISSDLLETALVALFLLIAAGQAVLRRTSKEGSQPRPRTPRPGHGAPGGGLEGAGGWRALLEGREEVWRTPLPAPEPSTPSAEGAESRSPSVPAPASLSTEREGMFGALNPDFGEDRPSWQMLGAGDLAHVPSEDAPASGVSLAESLASHEGHARRARSRSAALAGSLGSVNAWRDAVVAAEVLGLPVSLRSTDQMPGALQR